MAETETVTVQPEPVAHEAPGAVLGFDGEMVLLTWVAFLIAALVLGKVLWRPILAFVESREQEIKRSLDDATQARKAAEAADAKAEQVLAEAAARARADAEAKAQAAKQHILAMEAEAREALAAKRQAAEARLEEERAEALKQLNEQAGAEIASALDRLLPGLLTDEQRQAYQDTIVASVQLKG